MFSFVSMIEIFTIFCCFLFFLNFEFVIFILFRSMVFKYLNDSFFYCFQILYFEFSVSNFVNFMSSYRNFFTKQTLQEKMRTQKKSDLFNVQSC